MKILTKIFKSKQKFQAELDTALFRAIFANDENAVIRALRDGANPNAITVPQDRPLHFAVDYGSAPIFEALVNAGADAKLAIHIYPCFRVPLSEYALIQKRPDLLEHIRTLENEPTTTCSDQHLNL